jgi:hypothetical protein
VDAAAEFAEGALFAAVALSEERENERAQALEGCEEREIAFA